MTIKDLFDTPINEMWEAVNGFVYGYLAFFIVMLIVVIVFIGFVAKNMIGHRKKMKEMSKRHDEMRSNIMNKRRGKL